VIKKQPVNLREVLVNSVKLISAMVTDAVQLTTNIPTDIAPAMGDESRIQQIMQNLLGNAAKFTRHGSITVEVSGQNELKDEDKNPRILVVDGLGVVIDVVVVVPSHRAVVIERSSGVQRRRRRWRH
jgi:signal transduction histidine kinase